MSFLLSTYPPFQRKFVSSDGVYLYDEQGKQYLDFLAGIAVTNIGHSNKEIAHVLSEQASKLQHVSNYFENEYTHEVSGLLNSKISRTNDMNSGKVFFSNSGAEANECAIKVAKRYGNHSRYKILTAKNSFHGRTIATLSATGQPAKHEKFLPLLDHFKYFDFGDIDSLAENYDNECVAVLIEIVQGEGGVNVAEKEFYSKVEQFCKERDLLFMVDEVQTGMCRTGEWFAFQHFDLNPDVVTMAKALGNGFPVGATWIKDPISEVMGVGDHGSTYGGQPLALCVVKETIRQLEENNLALRSQNMGEVFKNKLNALDFFDNVRGLGLMIGADLNLDLVGMDAKQFVELLLDNGFICNAVSETTVRFVPPLIIDESHIDKAVALMKEAVANG